MSVQYRIPAFTAKVLDAAGNMSKDWYLYLAGLASGASGAARALVPGVTLTGSVASYYTANNVAATITAANLSNPTGSSISASIYLVASGQSPNPSNLLISGHSIGSGGSYQCPELIGQVLARGGSIQAVGSGLSFSVSGTEAS